MASIGPVTVTALAGHVMHFRSMTGTEELGRLFEYNLELLCNDHDIKLAEVLGQSMTVSLQLTNSEELRHFNGYVSRFALVGHSGDQAVYRATLHPWLWFLTRAADCRIFPEKDVPAIVKRVFGKYKEAAFEGTLPKYPKHDYVVQYRETDFNFVSRLMEQEGIYYFFKHDATKHTLVFADSIGAHDRIPGTGEIPYIPPTEGGRRAEDHLDDWRVSQEIQPSAYSMKNYDFKTPRGDLLAVRRAPQEPHTVRGEIYDYPGVYLDRGAGETQVGVRLAELHTDAEVVEAEGNPRALGVGSLFSLAGFARADQNREYLVTRARYHLRSHALGSGGEDEEIYRASYTLLDSSVPFRPARVSVKPFVQGPQTATVVGAKKTVDDGAEIWTDEFGRVRVRFPWERLGPERTDDKDAEETEDEDKTCWVRVSQVWAGAQWGAMHIPRIGQEVIVDFLEGDPDRPIITGRVYNGTQMPPYTLPDNKTQSGIKSRSTPGGGPSNFNEIRFEDKKGSEELFIQAEKNQTVNVKAAQSVSVGASRSLSVGENEKVDIGINRTETVGADESVSIGANQKLSVRADRTKIVTANEKVTIGISSTEDIGTTRMLTVGTVYQVTVGAAMNESIGAAKAEEIGGAKIVTVGALSSEVVGAAKTVTAGGSITQSAGKDMNLNATNKINIKAGDDLNAKVTKKTTIDVGDELILKCGDATIVMKKNGDISIKGKKISINASGDLVLKGSKIAEN